MPCNEPDTPRKAPKGYTCEHCWMEDATQPAPPESGMTWLCDACAAALPGILPSSEGT